MIWLHPTRSRFPTLIADAERGEYLEITRENMHAFFEEICREGREEFQRKKLSVQK